MNVEKKIEELTKDRDRVEACFIMSLWKETDLYEMYPAINVGGDKTIRSKDGQFYFALGKNMYAQGFRIFDQVSVESYLAEHPKAKSKFEEKGGFKEIREMMSVVDPANVDAYFDRVATMNFYSDFLVKCENAFENTEKLKELTADEAFDTFENLVSEASIKSGSAEMIENLTFDETFINKLDEGESKGFSYRSTLPMLNYVTLGAMPGSLYMIGAHSGSGKSSLVFEGFIMGLHEAGVKTAIISNEMMADSYQLLLMMHILTKDLDYYDLTRKQLKLGGFTPEQKKMLARASEISKEKYSDIKFVKTFSNSIGKILKYMRKLRSQGVEVIIYDTFKSDDEATSSNMWQTLMLDARKLFQASAKLGICCITTYQLALHTENYRYLTASCLSNSKQIKEVYETMVYMRPLWQDEYPGEKYDVKAHKFETNPRTGKKDRVEVQLEKDEKYLLLFIDKTRADEDKKIIILKWRPRFNEWKEVGYATVINDHRQGVV